MCVSTAVHVMSLSVHACTLVFHGCLCLQCLPWQTEREHDRDGKKSVWAQVQMCAQMCVCCDCQQCSTQPWSRLLLLSDYPLRLLHQSIGQMKSDSCRAAKKNCGLRVWLCVCFCMQGGWMPSGWTWQTWCKTFKASCPNNNHPHQICFSVPLEIVRLHLKADLLRLIYL